jgi:hypothetical protein
MTEPTVSCPHTMTTAGADRRPADYERRSVPRPNVGLVSEAVVASYIHDLSRRSTKRPLVERVRGELH